MNKKLFMNTAIISECGTYRYKLTRHGETMYPERGTALFVMLNPSTADATEDDPTIRRCRGFAKTWGCSGIVVANLYALRSTNPAALCGHHDAVGPDNDMYLRQLALEYGEVICAWGKNADPERVKTVLALFNSLNERLWCLGTNNDGSPKHPLYIKASQPLVKFSDIEDSKGEII